MRAIHFRWRAKQKAVIPDTRSALELPAAMIGIAEGNFNPLLFSFRFWVLFLQTQYIGPLPAQGRRYKTAPENT